MAIGVVLVLFLVFGSDSSTDPGTLEGSHPAAFKVEAMKLEADEAWRALRLSCEETATPLPDAICTPAREAARQLQGANCWAAQNSFSELQTAVGKADIDGLFPALTFETQLKEAMAKGCPK
jgi:hypothetical protein